MLNHITWKTVVEHSHPPTLDTQTVVSLSNLTEINSYFKYFIYIQVIASINRLSVSYFGCYLYDIVMLI